MKWAFDPKRNLRNIPDHAWEGESFEINAENSERAEAIKLDDPKYWAFRFVERLKDHNRIWTTEVGIAENGIEEAIFGCRLLCAQKGDMETVPRSIPRFVRSIAFTKNAYLDGRRTSPDPWIVRTLGEVDDLATFLLSPTRKHPVVVFSTPNGCNIVDETVFPVQPFLRRTVGFVHTVVLTSDASYALTNRFGAEFSVFNQAIRTYNPGFDPEGDLWTDHPLATAERIRGWDTEVTGSFIDFLVQQSLRLSRPRDVLEKEQPPFQEVKLLAAQTAREQVQKTGQVDAELVALLEDEVQAAKNEAAASFDLAVAAETEKEQAIDEVRQIKASYLALQARVDSLQSKLKSTDGNPEQIPSSLKEMQKWAEKQLSGDVELHERALKAVAQSDFKDIKLVYNALLMLRDFYVPTRRVGGTEKLKAYQKRLAELGLEDTKCFSQENRAKNFGGTYFVRYQGDKRELDWHLKGRNSRDERYGFRLYYFWDAETSRVVVGHLPSHLKNDRT